MSAAPWWITNQIIPGGKVTNAAAAFSGDQQEKFGVDEEGKILDQAKFDATIAHVKKVRAQVELEEVSIDSFAKWRADIPNSQVVHIKGFGHGIGEFYDADILKSLEDCKLLVWDGDGHDETGFTKLVPLFLRSKPAAKAVAFKLNYEVDNLKEDWASVVREFPGRIAVVPVELIEPDWRDAARFGVTDEMKTVKDLPDWAQEYFLLGRLAIKVTGSKRVISLGGGGITANEATVGMRESGMEWCVYALSRGRQEMYPTLLNWAACADGVKLVKGKDPRESEAFAAMQDEVAISLESVDIVCESETEKNSLQDEEHEVDDDGVRCCSI